MRIAPEAWPFVAPFLVIALAAGLFRHWPWAILAGLLAVGILLFFRHPARSFTGPPEAVIAPADGKVLRVETVEAPDVGPGRYQQIVTFLSVFDVHIQSVPVDGAVVHSALTRGAKVAAFRGDAGEVNERHLTVLELANGDRVGIRQIVGLVARRIVCDLEQGDQVRRGERMGLIKFGSRVDLFVPERYGVQVKVGDRLRNGETLVALPPDGS